MLSLKDPKDKESKPRIEEIPAGFVLWSTGIGAYKGLAQALLSVDCPDQPCNLSRSVWWSYCQTSSIRRQYKQMLSYEWMERQGERFMQSVTRPP